MTDNGNAGIYLFDGHALCYRAFHAIKGLSNSSGQATGAVLGFINAVRRIISEHRPRYVVMAFDSKAPTRRHRRYEEYKEHRAPMPEELISQMPYIMEYVEASSFPVYRMDGYEADDIIATLTKKASDKGLDVTIVTGDKDALQLVDEKVKVLSSGVGSEKLYDAAAVERKYGVAPSKMAEFMALVGDPSDNIPGVKGIGKVTAAKLIGEFGTVRELYAALDKVTPENVREKLRRGREKAFLSRELVELELDVPVELELSEGSTRGGDRSRLIELYSALEFKKLLSEVMPEETGQESDHSTISNPLGLGRFLENVGTDGVLAFEFLADESGALEGIAFSRRPYQACYVPLDDGGVLLEKVKEVLGDAGVEKAAYDAKSAFRRLAEAGIPLAGVVFDVMIADYLADPGRTDHDLASVAARRLNLKLDADGLVGASEGADLFERQKLRMDGCTRRCETVRRLCDNLIAELRDKALDELFRSIEMPLVPILAEMEGTGVGMDLEHLKESAEHFRKKIDDLTARIHSVAGERFNINSPKQLQRILFEKLGLRPRRKTKTGYSTDEGVLSSLADEHELPVLLLEYRHLNKLKTAYYDSLIALTDSSTGILHTTFNQTITATGRLSSSEPNIQNIPIRTDVGKLIRKAFVPPFRGHLFVGADYSQIELRILAHLSGDGTLIEAFRNGRDVHALTASLIFDRPVEDVTEQMRRIAKTVNFGIVYGMGRHALASGLDIPESEAAEFIEAYFSRYPDVKGYMDKSIVSARENGYVTTLFGRRRYLPEINSADPRLRAFAERTAINTPVQGTAADIIKKAMIATHRALEGTACRMIMQVHDELLFSVPEDELVGTAGRIKALMEGVVRLEVELKVDIESGANWYDMEKVLF